MLRCAPDRTQFVQAQGQQVWIGEVTPLVVRGSKGALKGDLARLSVSSKVIKSFEHSSAIQCLDWAKELLAFGSQDGSVGLYSSVSNARIASIPVKQQRSCTSVTFNSSTALAIGHDKVRNDHSLSIYDTETQVTLAAFANSEAVSSLCWLSGDPHCILAGVNHRWLRILDTRAASKDNANSAPISVPTTAVYEITSSPDSYLFAGTFDNNILVWDRRKLDVAVLALKSNAGSHSCRVNQLRFDPVKHNTLVGLSADGTIDFWNLQDSPEDGLTRVQTHDDRTLGSLFVIPALTNVNVGPSLGKVGFDFVALPKPFSSACNVIVSTSDLIRTKIVSSRFQQPSAGFTTMGDIALLDEGRLWLERSPLRKTLNNYPPHIDRAPTPENDRSSEEGSGSDTDRTPQIPRRTLLTRQLSAKYNGIARALAEDNNEPENKLAYSIENDVSSTIYRRAKLGYGLEPEVNKGVAESESLRAVWTWLAWSKKAYCDGNLAFGDFDFAYEGCLNIWNGLGGRQKKTFPAMSETFLEAVNIVNQSLNADIFPESFKNSPIRKLALASTGWCMTTAEFVVFRDDLVQKGETEKAAFYSVAQDRDIQKAIEIMSLKGVSLSQAVSDYRQARGDDVAMRGWYNECPTWGIDLDSPYIRAIFAYLTANDWRDVIDEQGLSLRERLAITLRYIRDEEVGSILQDLCRTETAEGNLEGLLLIGINIKSIDLLQAYVNRTADVQTAALIIALRPELSHEKRAQLWIAEYKALLMTFNMPMEKCRFDLARTTLSKDIKLPRYNLKQVSFRCYHCNALINHLDARDENGYNTHETKASGTRLTATSRQMGSLKSTLCSHCRKALPKCVLCLLPVGNTELFCVCLACSHTSHTAHAEEWFQTHTTCPAPGCPCACRDSM